MCPAPRTGASAPPSRSRSRPLDARSARAATVSPPAASTMGNGRSPQTRVELRHRPARRVLAKARAGDRTAFEQVYRRFERPVFAMALRICGDREEAFEVLQETMLKVYDRIGGFRGESPFWAWLRRIALNEALMALRRGRRLGLPARPQARAGAGRDPRADGLAARSAGAAAPARRAAEAPGAGRRPPSGPADTRPGARNLAEPGLPGRPGEPGRPLTRNRPRHARRSRRFLLGEDQLVVAGVARPIALVAMADAHFATALQQAQ